MQPKADKARPQFIEVCENLLARIDHLPDHKTKQLVGDGLAWAIKNPTAIHMHSNGSSLMCWGLRQIRHQGWTTMGKAKRAALYVRVSTDHQSVESQICE